MVYADPRSCDLIAVGSELKRLKKSHFLHRLGFTRQVDLWGTGSLRPNDRLARSYRPHAVRGRLTLALCDVVDGSTRLGDPGLLAGLLLDRPIAKRYGTGVIPHLMDRGHPKLAAFVAARHHVRLLDIGSPAKILLREMAECEQILSSSLHGLVFADALGIPNRWVTISGQWIGGRHKFDDYYSAFGIEQQPARLAEMREEAAACSDRRPGIEELKRGLIASFPG